MKIALIGTNVVPKSQIDNPMQYNIALYYLASYLKSSFDKIHIDIVDIPVYVEMNKIPDEFSESVCRLDADIYGFSSYCWDRDLIIELIKHTKIKNRDSRIVLGGPTATFEGLRLMKEHQEIDLAVVGEGENVLADIVRSENKECNLKGLIYRKGSELCFGGYSEPIRDLDTIPSPYITGMIKPKEMNLMLGFSRGCINKCKHCAWKSIGGGIRYFSKRRIKQELLWAKENRYKHIFIYDSSINSSTERLRDMVSVINDLRAGPDLSFTYFIDHTRWCIAQKKLLKNINARCILVGLESVSKGASVSLGRKPVDKREFARFIGDISDVGPVMISVMLGIPTETGKDFRSTVEYVTGLVEKYGRDRIIGIRVFWTVVTPGSRLSYESKKYKIRYALRGMPYVLSSEMFSRKDMIDSFEYIQKHKFSDMFIWEDSDPGRYYAEIKDFSILPEYREKYDKKKAIDIRQLIPGCRIGAGFYNKWKLISIGYEHEYPLLKFRHQSDNGMIILKVLYKITDSPFKTKKYSVSVCNTVDPEYDEDLKSICNKLISEISKNE